MRFRLFGVTITVRFFFWVTALLFGMANPSLLPIWVAILFVSILIHELGHALAVMRHGIRPEIVLHGLGGTTYWDAPWGIRRRDHIVISLAGPVAGLVFGGLVYAAVTLIPHGPLPGFVSAAISMLLYVNIAWSFINLIPVLPFDGGHVLEHAMGPRRARLTLIISLVVAVIAALVFAWLRQPWGAILFVMSAVQAYQTLNLPAGATLVNPLVGGRGPSAGTGPGPIRRAWLQFKLRRLQAEAARHKQEAPRRRAGGPSLRVIQGGSDRPPKNKNDLN